MWARVGCHHVHPSVGFFSKQSFCTISHGQKFPQQPFVMAIIYNCPAVVVFDLPQLDILVLITYGYHIHSRTFLLNGHNWFILECPAV